MAVVAIPAAALGALIGSFLNVVAYRLPRGMSIVMPRSSCPSCDSPVRPRDNVPVLSWLLLRGRCRDCRAAISPRYPLIEAGTAGLFATVVAVLGFGFEAVLGLPFVALLVAVTVIDLEHRVIPNRLLAPMALLAPALLLAGRPGELVEHLLAAAIAGALLLVAAVAYPGGMGMGDVKLAAVMGLYLGASVAPALLLAFLAGSLVGLGIIAARGPAARKQAIPFGPFLALGGLIALLVGPELVDLYRDELLA